MLNPITHSRKTKAQDTFDLTLNVVTIQMHVVIIQYGGNPFIFTCYLFLKEGQLISSSKVNKMFHGSICYG